MCIRDSAKSEEIKYEKGISLILGSGGLIENIISKDESRQVVVENVLVQAQDQLKIFMSYLTNNFPEIKVVKVQSSEQRPKDCIVTLNERDQAIRLVEQLTQRGRKASIIRDTASMILSTKLKPEFTNVLAINWSEFIDFNQYRVIFTNKDAVKVPKIEVTLGKKKYTFTRDRDSSYAFLKSTEKLDTHLLKKEFEKYGKVTKIIEALKMRDYDVQHFLGESFPGAKVSLQNTLKNKKTAFVEFRDISRLEAGLSSLPRGVLAKWGNQFQIRTMYRFSHTLNEDKGLFIELLKLDPILNELQSMKKVNVVLPKNEPLVYIDADDILNLHRAFPIARNVIAGHPLQLSVEEKRILMMIFQVLPMKKQEIKDLLYHTYQCFLLVNVVEQTVRLGGLVGRFEPAKTQLQEILKSFTRETITVNPKIISSPEKRRFLENYLEKQKNPCKIFLALHENRPKVYILGLNESIKKFLEEFKSNFQIITEREAKELLNIEMSVNLGAACPICYEKFDNNKVELLNCKHFYCKDCLYSHVKERLDDSSLLPVGCPHCSALIPLFNLLSLLSQDEIRRLSKLALSKFLIQNTEKYFTCATVDCPGIGFCEDKFLDCQFCERETCNDCKAQHNGLTCEQFTNDHEMEEVYKQHRIRKCSNPACKVPQQKIAGCNHVKCTSCEKHVCFFEGCTEYFEEPSQCYTHMRAKHGNIG
eukprot:TRINITY_DN5605_c0_g2_i9.p1 TRINITY_DN5605_c0_g2~~TRINITY_DN5605_c0_g2_i9.p1  ORF type:complete len:718 (+),score=63.98 TRINITY_DN5605_c0_g2_i9:49-2154(+)